MADRTKPGLKGCLFDEVRKAGMLAQATCNTFLAQFGSVQSLSPVWLFVTPWTAARRPLCPSPTPRACSNSCPLNQWCHPTISSSVVLFPSCLQSCPASRSNESFLGIRWPKYWSFSFSISPSNEYSGLISFRMDWLDLLPGSYSPNLSFLCSPTASYYHLSGHLSCAPNSPY